MRGDASGPHAPFEQREDNGDQHEQAMLRDLGILQAFDQSDAAHRPDLGIRAKE